MGTLRSGSPPATKSRTTHPIAKGAIMSGYWGGIGIAGVLGILVNLLFLALMVLAVVVTAVSLSRPVRTGQMELATRPGAPPRGRAAADTRRSDGQVGQRAAGQRGPT